MTKSVFTLIFFAVAAVCVAGGCGPETGAGLVQVTGVITYNGQPLAQGSVSFVPTGTTGTSASGNIDVSGRYTLSTHMPGDGVAPGTYQVRIESWASEPRMDETGTHPGKQAIPEKYFDVRRSGLTATVSEEAKPQEINFDLTP